MMTHRRLAIASAVCLLIIPSLAQAAAVTYRARLQGTVIDPRAQGKAEWHMDSRTVEFNLFVTNVHSTDRAVVVIDGEPITEVQIVNTVGVVHISSTDTEADNLPRVVPGSSVALYDANKADLQGPIVFGTFRRANR